MSLDGLAALNAKREQAKRQSARHLPPPRHSSPVRPETASEAEPQKPSASVAAGSSATRKAKTKPESARTAPVVEPVLDELVRSTIYVRGSDDAWLEEIAIGGRGRRPRVDASRSAVVRLALERLRDDMSPQEVVDFLETKARNSTQVVGRKRL